MEQKMTEKNKKGEKLQNVILQKKSATKKYTILKGNNNLVTSTDIKDYKLLTIKDIIKILNVNRNIVAHLFKSKQLGYIVISKRKLVLEKDLLEYILSRRVAPLVGSS